MKTPNKHSYAVVKSALDDLGVAPASDLEVRSLRRLHIANAFLYVVLLFVSIGLLAAGRGTKVDAGYVFATAHEGAAAADVVFEARSTSVAEAFMPIITFLLAFGHTVVACGSDVALADAIRIGWDPVISIAHALVNPFIAAELALLARIADPEKVLLLMMAALMGTAVDQVSGGLLTSAKRFPAPMRQLEHFSISQAVYLVQLASATIWTAVWVVLLTNASWQVHNGTGVPSYTLPIILLVLGFFAVSKAHQLLVLTGRGCTSASLFRRECVHFACMLACVAVMGFTGLA